MEAVILAGGLGTRLRPLTNTRPKSLLPLANRPLILHVLDRLPASVDHVFIAARRHADALTDFFDDVDVGRRVTVVRERRALGTAGALRNLEPHLSNTVLVMNGDVVASLSIEGLLATHRRHGGVGTLALWHAEHVRGLGVVKLKGRRITRFVEKPPPGRAPSRWVNAGVYALEPELLAAIPKGRRASLERDVFPRAVRKGLYGHPFAGFWADAGTPSTILAASATLLREFGSEASRSARIGSEATLVKPFAVAASSEIHGRVGPAAAVGRDCVVGAGARIRNAILLDAVRVGNHARIEGSLVGASCRIGPRAVVDGCVLGDGVRVRADNEVVGRRVAA